MENKTVILLGGGKSISEGIELGLWEKIKDFEIWSINFGFMTMPYLPQREVWTDISFFRNNISALQELHEKKVKLYCKWHHKYDNFPQINTVKCARSLPLSPDKMYIGEMGLSGFFALGLATREKYSFIFCLGYDFGSDTNKTHYYQDDIKVESTGLGNQLIYRDKLGNPLPAVKEFEMFCAPDIQSKIYNVSPQSAIKCFEKIDYEEFFKKLESLRKIQCPI